MSKIKRSKAIISKSKNAKRQNFESKFIKGKNIENLRSNAKMSKTMFYCFKLGKLLNVELIHFMIAVVII